MKERVKEDLRVESTRPIRCIETIEKIGKKIDKEGEKDENKDTSNKSN